MSQDATKQQAAEAALEHLPEDEIIGVGTGSTVNRFIDALASSRLRVRGAVASSDETARRLERAGIPVHDLNDTGALDIYVDGADEANRHLQLVKGGGGALTREKIVAGASRRFVCIAEASKLVDQLGAFPLPVEVIAMGRSHVARRLVALGGRPKLREDFVTDNGHPILDVHDLAIDEPIALEQTLNDIPGVVTAGVFALRPADVLLLGQSDGVRRLDRQS